MNNQKGFNLIEVLIGLTIGLIGLLAVSQVFVTFNKQRNTATQTMEAQSNGAMALYLIERDLQMAGFGLMNIQDCALIQWYWYPPSCTGPGAGCGLQNPLSTQPVAVTDGGANSDQIEINYALAASAAPGSPITGAQPTFFDDPYAVGSTAGFAVGDMVVADVAIVGSRSCTMSQTTTVTPPATIAHAVTSAYNTASQPAGATGGWDLAGTGDLLVNLGTYVSKRYRVSADTLQMSAFPQNAVYNTVVEGILFMKLQYGQDTNADGTVDSWVDGTAAITPTQVLAMRIGLVARSPLYEKDAVDAPTTLTVLPATTGGAAVTWNVPDAHYRYKVYYTLIPLRNVIWGRP